MKMTMILKSKNHLTTIELKRQRSTAIIFSCLGCRSREQFICYKLVKLWSVIDVEVDRIKQMTGYYWYGRGKKQQPNHPIRHPLHHQYKRNSPSARREINTNKKQMLRQLKLWQCQILQFNRSSERPPISSYYSWGTARLRGRSNSQPRTRKPHHQRYRRQSLTPLSARLHRTTFRSRL